jgi:TRAP-type C4-dicarboxylate transport system substrate-binding protein
MTIRDGARGAQYRRRAGPCCIVEANRGSLLLKPEAIIRATRGNAVTVMKTCAIGLALALFGWIVPGRADDAVTLRFAVPGSGPSSPSWSMMWQPWIEKVEKDSNGTLTLQPFFNGTIATIANVFDRVVGGAADIGTGVQGSIGGKFPGSSVVELPSDIGGRDGAAAFWKLYQDGLIAPEYGEVHVVSLFVYPQSFLNANKPIARLDDVKGLKIATLTKADADVAQRLGAAPISTTPVDLYEILQRRTAEGVIIGWFGLVGFKLHEVTNHHLIAGLGSGGSYLVMNKDSYARLPPQAKAALDQNSGYDTSRDAFGAAMDRIYAASQNIVRGLPGHTITPLAGADTDRYQHDLVQPVIADWQARIPNGPAIFAAYRSEAARVRSQP